MRSVKDYFRIKGMLLGPQDPAELEALQAQEELAEENRDVAGIGSGIDKIIASIGRTQANPEAYMQMQKLAGEGPQRVREYLKNKYQQDRDASQVAGTIMSGMDREQDRAESRAVRADEKEKDRQFRKDIEDQRASEKQRERDEKKTSSVREVEERVQNIHANIDILDKMIEGKGTWEALGSHNQDLDRLVSDIATDTAKLMDPESVARPGEVDNVKKNLIRSGFQNSNASARQILKNFKNETARRAETAYKLRGLERAPQHKQPAGPAAGDVVDGYVFKGGDPSKKENWEKSN